MLPSSDIPPLICPDLCVLRWQTVCIIASGYRPSPSATVLSTNQLPPSPGATEYPQTFYVAQQPVQGQMALTTFARPEQPQRKRPKYTRSKTGCLTCRTKKVKVCYAAAGCSALSDDRDFQCDEEKPDCARCRSSQREVGVFFVTRQHLLIVS